MNPEEEKIPSLPEEGKSCRPEVPEEHEKKVAPRPPLKVIISQPMRGKPEAQIRSERAELVRAINNAGDVVVDTIFPDFPEGKNVPLKFLARSL
jgi:hypothetical protein